MRVRFSLALLLLSRSTIADGYFQKPKSDELGIVRVTKYTHNEGGRWTASGYYLKDSDNGTVCAASRDLWKKKIQPGDVVVIEAFGVVCEVLDTMADKNSKGFKQRNWIDIYTADLNEARLHGIQKASAQLYRPDTRSERLFPKRKRHGRNSNRLVRKSYRAQDQRGK